MQKINFIKSKYIFSNKPIKRLNNVKNKTELLKKLKLKIENVENCELKKNAKNLVFSSGDHNSSLMLVGEGPGQREDEMGIPFVGDAGKLLDKMLKAINIDRSKTYVTNVVNYRPPNNRKPNQSEINFYTPFLMEHISIINPKIIILLGSCAMETFFGDKTKISNMRGHWKNIIINSRSYLAMVTFHPAYLLRQADQKKNSWIDLKEIKKKINEFKINI